MPFEHSLGLRVTGRFKNGVAVRLSLTPGLLNTNGVVHGGILASVADEAAWHAVQHHYGDKTSCTTTELKVNYLLPVQGKRISARAHVVRAGKTLCVSRVDLFDDSRRLCALAVVTYMILAGAGKR